MLYYNNFGDSRGLRATRADLKTWDFGWDWDLGPQDQAFSVVFWCGWTPLAQVRAVAGSFGLTSVPVFGAQTVYWWVILGLPIGTFGLVGLALGASGSHRRVRDLSTKVRHISAKV